MLKSIYIITICVWDYFTGLEIRRLEYETLLEAFTEYKSRREDDCDLGDHWQTTTLSHIIIYVCEPHKQHGLKKTDSTMEDDIGFILPEGERFSDVKDVVPAPVHEEEYVFVKDEYIF